MSLPTSHSRLRLDPTPDLPEIPLTVSVEVPNDPGAGSDPPGHPNSIPSCLDSGTETRPCVLDPSEPVQMSGDSEDKED